jgi:hypothetical protein
MLVRQTNEYPPPELDPVASAALAKEQWGYYEAAKRVEEQKAKAARKDDKDKTCWLRSAVAELDASSVATLRKSYADMFECKEPQWKINMEKHIANLREREESSKDGIKDDNGKDKGDA